ncbi:MAG: 4-alpha-glucanotransferase [Candidatus Omnitrophica bacterium]|nr:4-alpha-glucanotransferase [Candidatus Omnitrophota bacterium]
MSSQPHARELLATASKNKWEAVGTRRRAGVVVPLASVYSGNSIGIGDLDDLKLVIDWCRTSGHSILQLLPMNEVGPISCPYDSTSSFALEPMYLSLAKLADGRPNSFKKKSEALAQAFPAGKPIVDYRIKAEKLDLLRQFFEEKVAKTPEGLQVFISENAYWLDDFALFNLLKSLNCGRAWYDWEGEYKFREPQALRELKKQHERVVLFQQWLQWQLSIQFKEAKAYARAQGVLLKGDLPILVSRDSADVWSHPEYFKLEFDAGAPPDMYCAKGQRWGTPTYNWERIFADDGIYVRQKLAFAQNFYDILRIDHVVGLLRIWSIPVAEPAENKGLHGFFDPKDEKQWEAHGRRVLEMLVADTRMLLCAEDLGEIPKACPKLLQEFGIPGNDVERWTKDWEKRHDFLSPEEYRLLSVAMLSTHDTTNWPAWWENEAGTVDEGLFIRRCIERHIDFQSIRDKLFDPLRSNRGRLRWRESVDSVDRLVSILGKPQSELWHFLDMYQNTFREKEKLWKILGLGGSMREACDKEILEAVFGFTFQTNSVFCINFITDLLSLAGIFKGDPYQYRYNTPGTVSDTNWSLVVPLSLEELNIHPVNAEIKTLIASANRV